MLDCAGGGGKFSSYCTPSHRFLPVMAGHFVVIHVHLTGSVLVLWYCCTDRCNWIMHSRFFSYQFIFDCRDPLSIQLQRNYWVIAVGIPGTCACNFCFIVYGQERYYSILKRFYRIVWHLLLIIKDSLLPAWKTTV